jgi:two-component system, chemotaxis family, CheB/CheR fusion protein
VGLRAIKDEGGLTLAEAETTAKFFAMPNSAIVAGCVDVIRGAKDIALELGAIARHPYVSGRPAPDGKEVKFNGFPEGADALTKVFYLINQHMGVKFRPIQA